VKSVEGCRNGVKTIKGVAPRGGWFGWFRKSILERRCIEMLGETFTA
jgi:hypothetical protein